MSPEQVVCVVSGSPGCEANDRHRRKSRPPRKANGAAHAHTQTHAQRPHFGLISHGVADHRLVVGGEQQVATDCCGRTGRQGEKEKTFFFTFPPSFLPLLRRRTFPAAFPQIVLAPVFHFIPLCWLMFFNPDPPLVFRCPSHHPQPLLLCSHSFYIYIFLALLPPPRCP